MYLHSGRSRTSLGRAVYLVATLLLASILHSSIISASPIGANQQLDVTEQLDDTSEADGSFFPVQRREDKKYPDLDECRQKCSIAADKSVFYSKVGKHEEKPQDFATKNGLKLVREAYPEGFTDRIPGLTQYKKFAQRFSQAYAEKTSGTAWVLLPTDGKTEVGEVWTKYEKPFLTSGGKCTRIVKVDPDDFSKKCVFWDKDNKEDKDMANCNEENGPIPSKFLPFPSEQHVSAWLRVSLFHTSLPSSGVTQDSCDSDLSNESTDVRRQKKVGPPIYAAIGTKSSSTTLRSEGRTSTQPNSARTVLG